MKKILIFLFATAAICLVRPAWAEDALLSSRIEKLEKNDQEILKKLDQIKAELEIVKVRASQR